MRSLGVGKIIRSVCLGDGDGALNQLVHITSNSLAHCDLFLFIIIAIISLFYFLDTIKFSFWDIPCFGTKINQINIF